MLFKSWENTLVVFLDIDLRLRLIKYQVYDVVLFIHAGYSLFEKRL